MPNPNARSPVVIDTFTVSASIASVELTGMTSEYSTYQVYAGHVSGVTPHVVYRFQEGGTSNTNNIYNFNGVNLVSSTATVYDAYYSNESSGRIHSANVHDPVCTLTIYNSQDVSEYTYAKVDAIGRDGSGYAYHTNGCTTFKNNSVVDGIEIFDRSGNNLTAGEFILIGFK
tara:strand:- start:191 stop:706 length:516 start_codon:yes stop_codon:yes gene_type:complete